MHFWFLFVHPKRDPPRGGGYPASSAACGTLIKKVRCCTKRTRRGGGPPHQAAAERGRRPQASRHIGLRICLFACGIAAIGAA
ncbi:hypothetical protein D1157_12780 [Anaerotruncus sp. X29]|nr:hypothetical protein [Anaerotruncus sp. 1XD42-93]NCE75863.1 hypothetical protein [Anaerotruncus sp. X29]RKJ81754.1 hypothetical protein D7Y41_25240 [Anaerotruncus sp. 1XD22-93]